MSLRNVGIIPPQTVRLDLRLQYVHRVQGERTMGVFWEIYNATNRTNFASQIRNRNSANFLKSVNVDEARSMQLGLRYTF